MLPDTLQHAVAAALRDLGDTTPIQQTQAVGGGCINHATRLATARATYLLKWNPAPLPNLFATEARGLALLQAAAAVRVPAVLATAEATAAAPAYILLEWLDGPTPPTSPTAQAALGQQLAALHRATAAAYGLDHDNYLGSSPQYNGWQPDWVAFFRERRLMPQTALAAQHGLLPTARRRRLERLIARLDEWLVGVERRPALLHGDLWGGNVIAGPGGPPALIDPAAYYGDREAEMAYTQLFGGFSSHFYRAYQEHWPLAPGYPDRRDLYNLYHLLNHLNIFGEGYGAQVDRVVAHYVG